MAIDASNIWQLTNALDSKPEDKTNTRLATVSRIDNEGHVWVSIPGGETETPTETTDVEVERGDTVTVEWRNNKLYVTGNSTQPATSTKRVVQIVEPIEETANEAAAGVGKAVEASKAAQQAAAEAAAAANATSQHFWYNEAGAHVTDDTKDAFVVAERAGFPDWQPDIEEPDYKPWYNVLLNSLGQVFRTASKYLASFTHSALTFFDGEWNGEGDGADHIVAIFGKDGAQIGMNGTSHINLDYHSLQLVDKEGLPYMHISDLRNAEGVLDIHDSFTTDDERGAGWYYLTANANSTDYVVKVNGVERTGQVEKYEVRFRFTNMPYPTDGDVIEAFYTSEDSRLKAYTLGTRAENAGVGIFSRAFGYDNEASGEYSSVDGYKCVASGIYSRATGFETIARGAYATTEGCLTEANDYAHAEGDECKALGAGSHAEGSNTRTSKPNAHAEGGGTVASGIASHAEGRSTLAKQHYSHAQNYHTITSMLAQTAMGTFNVEDESTTTTHPSGEGGYGKHALIIGNGTAEDARSNALTVDWNGDTWSSGLYTSERSSSGDTGMYVKRTDTDNELRFIIGTGGNNRGIWDKKINDWWVYVTDEGVTRIRSKSSTGINQWSFENSGNMGAPVSIFMGTANRFGTSAPSSTQNVECNLNYINNQHNIRTYGRHQTDGRYTFGASVGRYVNNAWVWHELQLHIAENGTRTVTVHDATAWRNGLGASGGKWTAAQVPNLENLNGTLDIGSGGTGQTGVTTTTTISQIITAGSGVTVSEASYTVWGKVAQLRVVIKTTAAKSGEWEVGTLVSGKRPKQYSYGQCYTYANNNYIHTNGKVYINGTAPANAQFVLSFMYLLA